MLGKLSIVQSMPRLLQQPKVRYQPPEPGKEVINGTVFDFLFEKALEKLKQNDGTNLINEDSRNETSSNIHKDGNN